MKSFRFRVLLLGIACVLFFSAAKTSSISAAVNQASVVTDTSEETMEETAEDTVNGTAVGMMVSGIVMVVVVMTFLGRIEKKKKKYINSNLSLS